MSRPESFAPPAPSNGDTGPDSGPDTGPEADPGAAVHALLAEPLSQALDPAMPSAPGPALRQRLQQRLAASLAAEAGWVTRRWVNTPVSTPAPGVSARCLYRAEAGRPLRPGEPLRTWLLDLAPGASLPADGLHEAGPDGARPAARDTQREWLLLQGDLCAEGLALGALDHHSRAAGLPSPAWTAPAQGRGARLLYRESLLAAGAGPAPAASTTVRDADAGWAEFAPGVRRRVLWQHAGEASLLYRVEAGASVPLHTHGHDEECLMVEGDLFLDDRLLRAGDYQLAPAGSRHWLTETDTGGVLYAHGDLDLRF